ncbi:hypothetical protein O181_031234 [Austropuccinia psidii MF-1]|uniref:Uncharacterized protein n=1 Tax=Austropuccinia psidii MF-1 TaxID=1389203 RepID=A0A9Q3CUG2_9BASI|nr:hypothetical protein [Austropuccinia psidii MF-1]
MIPESSLSQYSKIIPACLVHYSIFHSSPFSKSIHFQAFPGFTTEAISYSRAQKITNGHLPTTKTVVSTSKRREYQFPLLFPAAPLFQKRENWPVWITREDPNMESKGQYSVDRLFEIVDRNSREVISYANDRMIPGTSSEKMASKFTWYEYELMNDFKRTFDYMGREN